MDLSELLRRSKAGDPPPISVLVGAERFLVERAIAAVRSACVGDGVRGFNDDVFHGRNLRADTVRATARTLPMMADRRFLLVRDAEHMASDELTALAALIHEPVESACLVISAEKLDGRSKLVKAAKAAKVLVEAKELKGAALAHFVSTEAEDRGHRLDSAAATALVDAIGADLSAINDALERLSLYVGEGNAVALTHVEACVTRVRTESIWALVDSVSARDAKKAIIAAESLLQDREPPLRILFLLARQLRMVARMREALASGLGPPEAAKRAGAPPFKARELTEAARRFALPDLQRAFGVLAEADLELKGSRRPDGIVLEEAILRLCSDDGRSRYSAVVRGRRRLLRSGA